MRSYPPGKVLYVSDSLGTPIHPRGIFNYSISILEILRSLGMEVTLVVEGRAGYGGYGLSGSLSGRLQAVAPRAADAIRIAEIQRYYNENEFLHTLHFSNRLAGLAARWWPALLRAGQRAVDRRRGPPQMVDDLDLGIDAVPKAGHLRLADRLLIVQDVYTRANLWASNTVGTVDLDASGYDVVFIDTPTNITPLNIAKERVVSVVHDLIPIREWNEGPWLRMFMSKLHSTIHNTGHFIFVSDATREDVHQNFPQLRDVPHTILYPAIRSALLASAQDGDDSPFSSALQENGARIRSGRIERNVERVPASALIALALGQITKDELRGILTAGTAWDPAVPFFATVVSDEPRKNIGIFIEAAEALRGLANIVILGQVDGGRHMGGRPDRYPNLHFTGYVSESEKLGFIRASSGLIFPSFSEGFGIPVVEGAVFGRPVICSDIPVFREITGGLATYIDPRSPQELVNAVRAILDRPEEAAENARSVRDLCLARYRQTVMAERLKGILSSLSRPLVPARAA